MGLPVSSIPLSETGDNLVIASKYEISSNSSINGYAKIKSFRKLRHKAQPRESRLHVDYFLPIDTFISTQLRAQIPWY